MQFKIVYLDDEADLCDLFKLAFESDQVIIKTFTEAEEAINEIQNHPPNLIFLDYRLPKTTGDAVALRLDPVIPIALITGDLTVLPKASFIKIFKKPFKYKEMQDFIASFVARS